jgi:hypothetical protein
MSWPVNRSKRGGRLRSEVGMLALSGLIAFVAIAPAAANAGLRGPRVVSASIQLRPTSGPAGTQVRVRGTGFRSGLCASVTIVFTDAAGTTATVGSAWAGTGMFLTTVAIPTGAELGAGRMSASQLGWRYPRQCTGGGPSASATFSVTGEAAERASAAPTNDAQQAQEWAVQGGGFR